MIKVCTCKQCKHVKKNKRTCVRKYFKRYLSKKRRKMKEGEVVNFYWA